MSLFQYQEWFHQTLPNARTFTLARLFDDRDQIIVGSLDGLLAVLDPGRDVDNRQETASLVEKQLPHPVLQIFVGRFLSAFDTPVIAVLHPKNVGFYNVVKDGEAARVDSLLSVRVTGEPAYNACVGIFGAVSSMPLICVQTINGTLHFFQDGNALLTRPNRQIHPGPVALCSRTDSVLTSAGGVLASVRFSNMTSTPVNRTPSDLMVEWQVNLGDTPVDIVCVSKTPAQPSLVVLCKRSLHCLTTGGAIRYTIRLEVPAMGVCVFTKGAVISHILATHSRTLLFYDDNRMIWTTRLPFIPFAVARGTYGEGLRSFVTLLSDDCRISAGILGTEPALYRLPATDTRVLDFVERRDELKRYEDQLAAQAKQTKGPDDALVHVDVDIKLDKQSNAYDAPEEVPSATISISINAEGANEFTVLLDTEMTCNMIGTRPLIKEPISQYTFRFNIYAERPVLDLRFKVVAISSLTSETVFCSARYPLKIACEKAAAQKAAVYKFSIDSSEASVGLNELFPEFSSENGAALGLRPFYLDASVSIFVSSKANRYRVQSDSLDFCFVVIDELILRLRARQPTATLRMASIPVQIFVKFLAEHLELEKQFFAERERANGLVVQMRHIEMLLMSKLKMDNQPPGEHVVSLLNHGFGRTMDALDRLLPFAKKHEGARNKSLRAVLDLFHLLLGLGGINLPFDGSLVDGTDQRLSERLLLVLPAFSSPSAAQRIDTGQLVQAVVDLCEAGGSQQLSSIIEEDEDEEEIADPAPSDEFVEPKSGALPVKLETLVE